MIKHTTDDLIADEALKSLALHNQYFTSDILIYYMAPLLNEPDQEVFQQRMSKVLGGVFKRGVKYRIIKKAEPTIYDQSKNARTVWVSMLFADTINFYYEWGKNDKKKQQN